MHLWMKIVIGGVVLAVLLVGITLYATSGITRAADAFVDAVGRKDMVAAQGHLASSFTAATGPDALQRFLADHGLQDMQHANWSSRQVANGHGTLAGNITTASGTVVPVSIELVKEHGAWKLYSLGSPQPGARSGADTTALQQPALPASDVQLQLLQRSMRDFAISADQRDMSHFRSTTARPFQQKYSTQALNAMFDGFMGHGDDLLSFNAVVPQSTAAPVVDANGVLTLEGRYPIDGVRAAFVEQFIQEDGDWKLVQFSLDVGNAPGQAQGAQ